MSYIGSTPEVSVYAISVDKFNGTGACTQFTLSRTLSDANTISVVVSGVPQVPNDAYTVSNGVLTFTAAPALGVNNIVVTFLVTTVHTQLIPGQLGVGSVTQTALATGAVTSDKIVNGTIQSVDLAIGAITGNLIANNAVSGNNIVSPPDIFDDAFLFGGM